MKITIPENATSVLTKKQRAILEFIVSEANSSIYFEQEGKVSIPMKKIATYCRTTQPTVSDAVHKLERIGLLTVERQPEYAGEGGFANLYSFPFEPKTTIPAIEEEDTKHQIAKLLEQQQKLLSVYTELLQRVSILEEYKHQKTISENRELLRRFEETKRKQQKISSNS